MRTVPAGGVVPTSWPPDFRQGMMVSSKRLRVAALTPGPARHSGANTETSAYSRFRIADISGGVMPEGSLVRLAGSERGSLPDVTDTAPVDTSERAEVTLVLRRRAELPEEIVVGPIVLCRVELAEWYGADPAALDLVLP